MKSNNIFIRTDYDAFGAKFKKADEVRKAVFTLIDKGITPEQYENYYKSRLKEKKKE